MWRRRIVCLPPAAHEKLDDNGLSGVAGALDGYTVPKSWYAGLIAQARGNESSARAAFEQAKRAVRDDLVQSPNDAKTLAMLALIHAAVGEKNEALGAATRARELLPIAKDSFDGPILATTLAAVSAKLGEKDSAIRQLESLVGVPNGPTPGTLRVEPEWDSLRDDPVLKNWLLRKSTSSRRCDSLRPGGSRIAADHNVMAVIGRRWTRWKGRANNRTHVPCCASNQNRHQDADAPASEGL
jgi:hypothetical protein